MAKRTAISNKVFEEEIIKVLQKLGVNISNLYDEDGELLDDERFKIGMDAVVEAIGNGGSGGSDNVLKVEFTVTVEEIEGEDEITVECSLNPKEIFEAAENDKFVYCEITVQYKEEEEIEVDRKKYYGILVTTYDSSEDEDPEDRAYEMIFVASWGSEYMYIEGIYMIQTQETRWNFYDDIIREVPYYESDYYVNKFLGVQKYGENDYDYKWTSVFPESGTAGQVLTKTSTGVEWANGGGGSSEIPVIQFSMANYVHAGTEVATPYITLSTTSAQQSVLEGVNNGIIKIEFSDDIRTMLSLSVNCVYIKKNTTNVLRGKTILQYEFDYSGFEYAHALDTNPYISIKELGNGGALYESTTSKLLYISFYNVNPTVIFDRIGKLEGYNTKTTAKAGKVNLVSFQQLTDYNIIAFTNIDATSLSSLTVGNMLFVTYDDKAYGGQYVGQVSEGVYGIATDRVIDSFSPCQSYVISPDIDLGSYTLGEHGHAEGEYSGVAGKAAHAEGIKTVAYGRASHVEGEESYTVGKDSHAEGYHTESFGDFSHAEGKASYAKGESSHAEGYGGQALGKYSHAEGGVTEASGTASHAEGENTVASGHFAHAEGYKSKAIGELSHAEGRETEANGYASHTEGHGTHTKSYGSHAQGKFNVIDSNEVYADMVGNGTESGRSNAFALTWGGQGRYAGDVYVNCNSDSTGGKKLATEEYVDEHGGGGDSKVVIIPFTKENNYHYYLASGYSINDIVTASSAGKIVYAKIENSSYSEHPIYLKLDSVYNRQDNTVGIIFNDTMVQEEYKESIEYHYKVYTAVLIRYGDSDFLLNTHQIAEDWK